MMIPSKHTKYSKSPEFGLQGFRNKVALFSLCSQSSVQLVLNSLLSLCVVHVLLSHILLSLVFFYICVKAMLMCFVF